MKFSIVIPAFNEEKYIGACIDSVIKHIPLERSAYEIIVANNASADRTKEIAQERGARVVDESRKGTSFARQAGFKAASGAWIAFFDADCQLHSGWYQLFQKLQQDYPKAVSFSGPYRYYDGTVFKRFVLGVLWWLSAPITYWITGYMILGGNFVLKREALERVGGFDTNITFYGDDTDTARRLRTQGNVMFFMKFYVFSSLRRFTSQGIIKTNALYVLNFIWPVLFKKPFSR